MTIELIRKSDSKEHTYKDLLEKAKALGYFHKEEDECPVCGGVRIKFNTKNKPYLYACVNGHRWTQDKWEPTKGKCKDPKCRNTVYKREMELNDGYCWQCRPYQGDTNTTTKKPEGSNKDSKEGAQQSVVM